MFELFKDRDKQFRFRLKARNGKIVATSEGYASKRKCIKGAMSVGNNAKDVRIVDKTKGGRHA